jgi:hypothetical protein
MTTRSFRNISDIWKEDKDAVFLETRTSAGNVLGIICQR